MANDPKGAYEVPEAKPEVRKVPDGPAPVVLEISKVSVGVYTVRSGRRRLGSVARMSDGLWAAYDGTGHAESGGHKTRHEAAETLRR